MALCASIWVVSCLAECAWDIDVEKDERTRQKLRRRYEETFRKWTALKWLAVFCSALVAASGLILLLAAITCDALAQPLTAVEIAPSLIPLMIAGVIAGSAVFELCACTAQGRLRKPAHLKSAADWCFVVVSDTAKAAHGAARTTLMNVDADLVDVSKPNDTEHTGLISSVLGEGGFEMADDDTPPMSMRQENPRAINIPLQTLN